MLGIAERPESRAEAQRGLSEAARSAPFCHEVILSVVSAQARGPPCPVAAVSRLTAHKSSSRPNSLPAPPHTPRPRGVASIFRAGGGVRSAHCAAPPSHLPRAAQRTVRNYARRSRTRPSSDPSRPHIRPSTLPDIPYPLPAAGRGPALLGRAQLQDKMSLGGNNNELRVCTPPSSCTTTAWRSPASRSPILKAAGIETEAYWPTLAGAVPGQGHERPRHRGRRGRRWRRRRWRRRRRRRRRAGGRRRRRRRRRRRCRRAPAEEEEEEEMGSTSSTKRARRAARPRVVARSMSENPIQNRPR